MARKSFSVLFFIKKGKLLKNGEAPVCMRITVNGCMADVSIKRSCPVNLWNPAKENSKGKDRMSVELNHYLGTFIKYYKISQLIHTQIIAN